MALGLGDAVLADLIEQRLIADLHKVAACLRFQLVASKAWVMASASASSLAPRATDLRPPLASEALRVPGSKCAPAASPLGRSSLIASFSSPRTRKRLMKLFSSRRLPGHG